MLIFLARERAGFPWLYFPLVSDFLGEKWKGQRNSMKIQSAVSALQSHQSKQENANVSVLGKQPLGRAGRQEPSPLLPLVGLPSRELS